MSDGIIKFDSRVDRDRFGAQIPINSKLTDDYLDRYGYVVEFDGEPLVTISLDKKYYYIVSIPKTDIKYRPLYFEAMTDKEVEAIGNKFSAIQKKQVTGKTLVFDTRTYLQHIESKTKFKRIKKMAENFQIYKDCNPKKIETMYTKWAQWRTVRKGQDTHVGKQELDEILYILEHKATYDTKSIFIEQANELIAFAVGCRHSQNQNIYVNYGAYGLEKPRNITLLAKYLRAKQYPKDSQIFDFTFTNDNNLTESKTEIAQPKYEIDHYSVELS